MALDHRKNLTDDLQGWLTSVLRCCLAMFLKAVSTAESTSGVPTRLNAD